MIHVGYSTYEDSSFAACIGEQGLASEEPKLLEAPSRKTEKAIIFSTPCHQRLPGCKTRSYRSPCVALTCTWAGRKVKAPSSEQESPLL